MKLDTPNRKHRETRGRKPLAAGLVKRACNIFRSDDPLIVAGAKLAGVSAPTFIAHCIRHGRAVALRILTGKPQMEDGE